MVVFGPGLAFWDDVVLLELSGADVEVGLHVFTCVVISGLSSSDTDLLSVNVVVLVLSEVGISVVVVGFSVVVVVVVAIVVVLSC